LNLRQSRIFWQLVLQRGRRIPLAYVLGKQAFMDFEVKVAPSVLIPRPETESLVEATIDLAKTRFPNQSLHILEIGTGSGCVSIALARALDCAMLYATDISPSALAIAQENAHRLGVEGRIRFIREDLFRSTPIPWRLSGGEHTGNRPWADIIVSNPPYIPSCEIPNLDPEVLREPTLALDGGSDGLDAIRAIITDAPGKLKAGGWLVLEIGDSQAPLVQELLAQSFTAVQSRKDLQGEVRIALAQVPELK
jgi:release factor glutamine methyltransferase